MCKRNNTSSRYCPAIFGLHHLSQLLSLLSIALQLLGKYMENVMEHVTFQCFACSVTSLCHVSFEQELSETEEVHWLISSTSTVIRVAEYMEMLHKFESLLREGVGGTFCLLPVVSLVNSWTHPFVTSTVRHHLGCLDGWNYGLF
jgi:hypothetical protein